MENTTLSLNMPLELVNYSINEPINIFEKNLKLCQYTIWSMSLSTDLMHLNFKC